MKEPKAKNLRGVLAFLRSTKAKYVSLDMCSRHVGVYPEVLGEELSYFAPSIMLDPKFNVRSLTPYLESYLEEKKTPRKAVKPASKKEVDEYSSVTDFVYRKMTSVGGLVDPSITLSDHDLRILQKLVAQDRAKLKGRK